MSDVSSSSRGVYRPEVEAKLPYRVFDSDNHFYPPEDAEVRHLEDRYLDRVFADARTHRTLIDVVGDEHKAKTLGEHPVGEHGGVNPLELPEMEGDIPVPGAMLNKLNPMKDLDAQGRQQLVEIFRRMEPAFQDRDLRLALMDDQGVEVAVLHGGRAPTSLRSTAATSRPATRPPAPGTGGSRTTGASRTGTACSPPPTSPWSTSTAPWPNSTGSWPRAPS